MRKRILIIGPWGKLGGVKTHVDHLNNILKPYALEIRTTQGSPFFQMLRMRVFYRPEIIVYNLSIYKRQLIRNLITRAIFFSLFPKRNLHIVHLHGGKFSDIGFLGHTLWRKLLKFYFNGFERVFCLTDEQYLFVSSFLSVPQKAQKIFNYVEIPHTNKLQKNEGTLNMLYLGRLHPIKGIMTAIDAVRQTEGDGLCLWIVGKGVLEQEISAINDPRIVFFGEKVGDEKNNILARADLFVLPSSWPEGLPYALLEAAAYGLALIATPVGAIDQILIEGRNGFFIKPGNVPDLREKIEKLLKDSLLLSNMGKESRKICAERFSIENLQEIYKEILQ